MLDPYEKRELLRLIEKMPTETPCMACVSYNCGKCMKHGEMIPIDHIKTGCDQWVFAPDSPPF